jgi:hypothetical protein
LGDGFGRSQEGCRERQVCSLREKQMKSYCSIFHYYLSKFI